MRDLIRELASGAAIQNWKLVEILVSEMGTLGITQALRCYADEFPDSYGDLAQAIRHVAECADRHKAYRNYYVHGITGVTALGIMWSDEMIERDVPVYEAVVPGPFGQVYQKSAKGRTRFINEYVNADRIIKLNNDLADLQDYIRNVAASVSHYLRGPDFRQTFPLREPPPLPDVLVKPELRHPKLQQRRALDRSDRTREGDEG